MSVNRWLQVSTLARLLAAVAFDVSRARLAHGPAVSALGDWPAFLVDMLEWPI